MDEMNEKMNKLESRFTKYLHKIDELRELPPTRARIKHLKVFDEKKFKAFHKFRFAVIRAVDDGYRQDFMTGVWYK